MIPSASVESESGAAARAIARAATACAVLDLAYVCAVFAPRGADPVRILQGIAAAVLGPAAFSSGGPAAWLGLLLHFAVATAAATGFVLIARVVPVVARRWLLGGALYGVAFYLVMNLLVLPRTGAAPRSFPPPGWHLVLLAHVLCVGWPIALTAHRTARSHR